MTESASGLPAAEAEPKRPITSSGPGQGATTPPPVYLSPNTHSSPHPPASPTPTSVSATGVRGGGHDEKEAAPPNSVPASSRAASVGGDAGDEKNIYLRNKESGDGAGETRDENLAGGEIDVGSGTALEQVQSTLYPHGLKLFFIVVALVMSIFLIALDMTIVATAIPKITDQFKSLNDVAWYGSAFFMTIGAFQSTWGKAYKYFPLKIAFLLSIFIFELGSLICGVAPNSPTLIVGRAVAGLGAAGIGSGAYTLIAFSAEPSKRPMFTGIIGAAYGFAAVVGPLIGGVFSDKVSWRWCFYINLPIGGLAGGIILIYFVTPSGAKPVEATLAEKIRQMDLPGTAVLMGAVICYILAFQYGGEKYPWNSSTVIGLLVGFFLLVLLFVAIEWYSGERAMIVPRLFRRRAVWAGSIYAFFFAGSYFVVIYYLPIYFQSIDNVSPTMSGVRNLPLIIAVTIGTIGSGIYVSRTGIAAPIAIGGAVLATIAAGLLYTLDIGTGNGKWIGFQVLGGFGWGSSFQIPVIVGQAMSSPDELSTVTAIILFFQTVGGAFFVSAGQTGFVNKMIKELPLTAPGVNVMKVIGTGATQLRSTFPADQIPGILLAYMEGVKVAFAVAIGGAGAAFVVSLFSSFKRLNTEVLKGVGGAA